MKFIELHMYASKHSILVNTTKISYIYEDPEGGTVICFAGDEDDYVVVEERYKTIKKLLQEM